MKEKKGQPDILRFPWPETGERLRAFAGDRSLPPQGARRLYFESIDSNGLCRRFYPPLVLAKGREDADSTRFLQEIEGIEDLGLELYLLIQSGAAVLGLFDNGELIRHKVIKKYVVRGKGRAQPSHLKTKGKSRYGSRLRLQNAASLLEEVAERANQWMDEEGRPRVFYRSCPIRLWPELKQAGLHPEFDEDELRQDIPLDVHRPNFEELMRVRNFCETGEIHSAPAEG